MLSLVHASDLGAPNEHSLCGTISWRTHSIKRGQFSDAQWFGVRCGSDVCVRSCVESKHNYWQPSINVGNLGAFCQETPQSISVTDSFTYSMRTKGKSYISTFDGILSLVVVVVSKLEL